MSLRDLLTPHEIGVMHGVAFAVLRNELRRKGLFTLEAWKEFMGHRMATLSMEFDTEEKRNEWSQACFQSYQRCLDESPPNVLAVLDPEGHA